MAILQYPLSSKREWPTLTITTTATGQSEVLSIGGATLSAVEMPAAWTAANLSFLASMDGTNFRPVYGSTGNEVLFTVGAARIVTFDPAFWLGLQYLKLRSGTNAAPVAQGASRTLRIALQALGQIK